MERLGVERKGKEEIVGFIHLFLLIAALVCLLMAAVGIVAPRGNLLAMGIFLWLLSTLVGGPGIR